MSKIRDDRRLLQVESGAEGAPFIKSNSINLNKTSFVRGRGTELSRLINMLLDAR